MTRIVKFKCGCIGTVPDAQGMAHIIATCEEGEPLGRKRDMNGKEYEPHEYAEQLIEFALSHQKVIMLRRALSVFGVPMYDDPMRAQLQEAHARITALENDPKDGTGANVPESLRTRNLPRL